MMLLEHISTRLINTPLLITPEYGSVVTTVLADRIGVQPMVGAEVVSSYKRPNALDHFDRKTGILTMPVVGGLVHRGDGPDAVSGLQSYTSLHNKFEALFADNVTRGILIDGDTGGGEAAGLEELAAWLPKASEQAGKPVWWIANTTTGSAAYWLASTSARFYAAPNSRVGAIGVYVQHVDMSKQVEKRGLVVSFIYAGDHKLDGNPFGPLPDEVRASIQSRVDKLYGDFVSAVASNRELDEKIVRETQAQVFGPQEAYDLGLVDGVGGLGSVLTAFTEHLNRPFVGFTSHGDSMTKELIYGQADLDRARAEGVASAKTEATASLTDMQSKLNAAADDRKALVSAFTEVAGADNPRVSVFVEALNDGVAPATAAKFAAKIEAPKAEAPKVETPAKSRTETAVDRLMSAHAANVSADGSEGETDPKAARLAEIRGSVGAYNHSKGFKARA